MSSAEIYLCAVRSDHTPGQTSAVGFSCGTAGCLGRFETLVDPTDQL